jgi:hypothetical protein
MTVRAIRATLAAMVLFVFTPHLASACNKTFYVYNRTDNTIVRLYVAPHASSSWEDDVIANTNAIEPDTYKRINMSADTRQLSIYDVKAILDDGSNITGGKINLCRAQNIYIYADRVTYSD